METKIKPGDALLRIWQAELDLSNADAARMFGTVETHFSRWRKGKTVPAMSARMLIEKVTNGAVPVEAWQ